MRLAILSDIHGNPIALDAVLSAIQRQGTVDGYLVLGDLVALGFDPVGVLERLAKLPNARFIRGNTDRYTLTGSRAWPSEAEVHADPALLPTLIRVVQSFAWTHGYLAATGWLDWLAALPLEQRFTLPNGTRVLGVHAAPGRDDDPGVEPDIAPDILRSMVVGCNADLVCVGHTHVPSEHHVASIHVVNVGCVSNPRMIKGRIDRRASYGLLDADVSRYRLAIHHVAYDTEAVVRAIHAHGVYLNADWLTAKFTDKRQECTT